jgi:hypothetical protein
MVVTHPENSAAAAQHASIGGDGAGTVCLNMAVLIFSVQTRRPIRRRFEVAQFRAP